MSAPAADRFGVGEPVRVRTAWPPGHIRTPHYLRGKRGLVLDVAGRFANPEELAYGRDGLPARTLYRVRFPQRELWPDYRGPASDSAVADIFEHWLEPLEEGGT
jgi:nitrile hydratase subunit beta